MLSDLGALQVISGQQPVVDRVEEDESDVIAQPRPYRDDPKSKEPDRGGKAAPARSALGSQSAVKDRAATPPGLRSQVVAATADRADAHRPPTEAELQAALEKREKQAFNQAAQQIHDAVRGDPALGDLASQLAIDMTPEGLRIQLLDADREAMFPLGSAVPTDHARLLLQKVAPVIARLTQDISIAGHTDATPFAGPGRTNWELSAERANATRRLLVDAGLQQSRVRSVTGNAERDPLVPADPLAAANRRIAIVVLRSVQQLSSPSISATEPQANPVPATQPVEPTDGQKWSVQSLKTP
jgi:chemotaxis protein MotB